MCWPLHAVCRLFSNILLWCGQPFIVWEMGNKKLNSIKRWWVLKHSIYLFMDVTDMPHAIYLIFAFFDSLLNIVIGFIYLQNPGLDRTLIRCSYQEAEVWNISSRIHPSRVSLSVTILFYPTAPVRLKLSTQTFTTNTQVWQPLLEVLGPYILTFKCMHRRSIILEILSCCKTWLPLLSRLKE